MKTDYSSTRQLTLPITGMTCANCAATVERALCRTEGVVGASVNYATERAIVELSEGRTTLEDLSIAVERVGYGVLQADPDELADVEAAARRRELKPNQKILDRGGVRRSTLHTQYGSRFWVSGFLGLCTLG